MINTSHPFYKKTWVRIVIPSFCILWALIEYLNGSINWAFFFGIVGLYSGYKLLIKFRNDEK